MDKVRKKARDRSNLVIPPAFAEGVRIERGAAGQDWLDLLPAKISEYLEKWDLTIDGAAMHGYIGIVFPVLQDETKYALKITWVDDETKDEALALKLWNGNGAVNLIDAEPAEGALLLERLNSSKHLGLVEIKTAITIAAKLLRRLAISAPPEISSLKNEAIDHVSRAFERWESTRQVVPKHYVQRSIDFAKELQPDIGDLLINEDLHYENVLSSEREPWLVIDPKVVRGDIEYGAFSLLLNRLAPNTTNEELQERFQLIVSSAEMNAGRAKKWVVIRAIQYWLWALEQNYDEDSSRCRFIIESMCS